MVKLVFALLRAVCIQIIIRYQWKTTVRNKILPSYSDFEKVVFNSQTTQRYIPEKCTVNSHYRENLILQYTDTIFIFLWSETSSGGNRNEKTSNCCGCPWCFNEQSTRTATETQTIVSCRSQRFGFYSKRDS